MNTTLIPETDILKTIQNGIKVINGYLVKDFLGSGSFSKVKLLEKNGEHYAVKIINKKQLRSKKKGFGFMNKNGNFEVNTLLEEAMREIAILKKINHQNIVRLHEIIQDDTKDKVYLILDYCNRGTLLSLNDDDNTFIVNPNITKNTFYTEDQIRDMTRDIVMAIDYLHMHGIIHRDIKPDNILIDDFNHCKLTDFNVSAMLENVNDDNVGKKIEGTDSFRAPECCGDTEESKDLRGKPLDIWALGVTCYLLAYLDLPFKAENEWDTLGLFDTIAKAEFTFRDDKRHMSNGFKEFIRKCFEKEPNKRITIEEIKELEWINEKRTPLREMKHPEKIFVTDEEIGKCASFFVSVGILKKLANTWKNHAGME